jgi:hypothetical protein
LNQSKIVILPIHLQGANTPREILLALRNAELEDLGKELYKIGIHTLEEIADISTEELYKVSQQIVQAGKFLVTLGDLPSITSSLVKAQLEKWPSMKLLQIDAEMMHQADQDNEWFVKVVDDLPEHVYFTLHIDGMNLDEVTWRELMNLTRELTHRRNVVGLDLIAPALKDDQPLFCAKLLYKILGLVFNNITRPLN